MKAVVIHAAKDLRIEEREAEQPGPGQVEVAIEAVRLDARTDREVDALIAAASEGESILPRESEQFFRLERRVVDGVVEVDSGFAVVVVERGTVVIEPQSGAPVSASRGATLVAAHDAGTLTLRGEGTVLLCRPPR